MCYLLFRVEEIRVQMALGQSMLCLRATSMLSFPGVCFPHPAALTGSPLENTIKAPLSVTNLIQDKPANPFADYKPMAGGSLSARGFQHLLEMASPHESSGFLSRHLWLKRTLYEYSWNWNWLGLNWKAVQMWAGCISSHVSELEAVSWRSPGETLVLNIL